MWSKAASFSFAEPHAQGPSKDFPGLAKAWEASEEAMHRADVELWDELGIPEGPSAQ